MAVLTIAMFIGLTTLAMVAHVHITDDPTRLIGAPGGYVQRTVIAQLSGAVFGSGSIGFYFVQTVTALILIRAANTAFNGFPILASILGMTASCRASWPGAGTVSFSATGSSSSRPSPSRCSSRSMPAPRDSSSCTSSACSSRSR
jgi:hypothetical protein